MRVPNRKNRAKSHVLDISATKEDLKELAKHVRYVGSGVHKRGPNPLAPYQWKTTPGPNSSICPANIRDANTVTGWLKSAIEKGAISKDGKMVWYIGTDGSIFEAMSSNNGEYHGYPIEEHELPKGVREKYETD